MEPVVQEEDQDQGRGVYLAEVQRLTQEAEALDVPREVLRDLHLVNLETERMRIVALVLGASVKGLAEVEVAKDKAEQAFTAWVLGESGAAQEVKEITADALVTELGMKVEVAELNAEADLLKAEASLVRSAEFVELHESGSLPRSVRAAVVSFTARPPA